MKKLYLNFFIVNFIYIYISILINFLKLQNLNRKGNSKKKISI